LHIIDTDSRGRAQLARIAYALGHHAEVYSGWDELMAHPPREGILVARDELGGAADAFAVLGEAGIWLPLILADEHPTTARVVEGIKHGALDFLELPCAKDELADALARVAKDAAVHTMTRRRMLAARELLAALSSREREVLDLLAEGRSNKEIARVLDISPRTVEIHRANMMAKLDARHPAQAVRLRIEARFEHDGALPCHA
jgi:FixJ family two-component response regulator